MLPSSIRNSIHNPAGATPSESASVDSSAPPPQARTSRDFIASDSESTSVQSSSRTWPRLTASNSHPRLDDFLLSFEAFTGSRSATEDGCDLPHRLFHAPSPFSEVSVVPASLPNTPARERTRYPSAESTTVTAKNIQAGRAFFASGGLFATLSEKDTRPNAVSTLNAQRFGLPPSPQYRDLITGMACPTEPSLDASPLEAPLIRVDLSDIVDGLPFEKTVVGVQFPDTGHVVVKLDTNVFYAASTIPRHRTGIPLRRLNPEDQHDRRCIEKYVQHKHQLKVNAMLTNPPPTAVNVARTLTHRAGDPDIETVRTALDTLTSPVELSCYIENCRAQLGSRQRFDAKLHKRDLNIYRTLLGDNLVFEENGQWNLSHSAGIAALRVHLGAANIAFATLGCESGVNVYFAISGGKRHEDLRLHIHEFMGDADAIDRDDTTFIDANRRLARMRATFDVQTAPQVRVNLPTLTPPDARQILRDRDAEQILAAVIEHDMRDDPIITDIHVNSLHDSCDSCTVALPMLGRITGHDISFVYHRDYGVTSTVSADRQIRMLKILAATANRLRGALLNGDRTALCDASKALLAPEMLAVITGTLRISSPSDIQPGIYSAANAMYLHLLASLTHERIVLSDDILAMLRSDEGKTYVSLIGYRIRNHMFLARAWCTLMRELTLVGVSAETLRPILFAKANRYLGSFWQELLGASSSVPEDHLDRVYQLLKQDDLNPSLANARSERGLLHALRLRALRYLNVSHRAPDTSDQPAPSGRLLPEIVEMIGTVISESVVIELEEERLRRELREALPSMTLSEQRKLRNMITAIVNETWQAELPGQSPPSDLVQSVLGSVGPALGRQLSAHRGPVIREIIDTTVDRYGKHLYRYVDATDVQMTEAYQDHLKMAHSQYTTLISDEAVSGKPAPREAQPNIQAQVEAQARLIKDERVREAIQSARSSEAVALKAREAAKESATSAASVRARKQANARAKEEINRAALWTLRDATRTAQAQAGKEAIIRSQREARERAAKEAGDHVRAATQAAKREARERAVQVVRQRIADRRQAGIRNIEDRLHNLRTPNSDESFQARLNILRHGEMGALRRLPVAAHPIGESTDAAKGKTPRTKAALKSTQ